MIRTGLLETDEDNAINHESMTFTSKTRCLAYQGNGAARERNVHLDRVQRNALQCQQ